MNAWRSTRTTILDTITAVKEQYPDYTLTLVGHYLGGAVAALAGTEMQLRGWDPEVTTFGEPRVGNHAFADYLDKVFGLDSEDPKVWKFRRVTHIHDPVPLVPLTEWGYRMHGGEIYISRIELPFSASDVHYCEGASDTACISGAENPEIAASLRRTTENGLHGSEKDQQVLSRPDNGGQKEGDGGLESGLQGLIRLPFGLVPPRFRLWELLYSHRDYFSRLGLCVPGGDPTGRW